MVSLEVKVDRVEEVLMEDNIIQGELISLGQRVTQRVIEIAIVSYWTIGLLTLISVSVEETQEHHASLFILLLLGNHRLKVSDKLI